MDQVVLVHPLNINGGEEGQDETKGANKVAWKGVDERKLLKNYLRAVQEESLMWGRWRVMSD